MSKINIPLSIPHLAGKEWAYVKEALDTNWVSSAGPFVDRFEEEIARSTGARFAVATVNGTAALHVALRLLGVGSGDEVVMSDLTFIAPANAVRYLGAWPVFIDAEERYWQMDVNKLEDFLQEDCESTREGLRNRHTGRIVRAIMPVHILGSVCDMEAILGIADRFGLKVVEDATESLGALQGGKAAGTFGRMGCLSFNGNKIITTGGGGMILTDDEDLARKARYLTTQAKDDSVEFVHGTVGYNYRMPNVLAAIGCAQLAQLPGFVERRRQIASMYREAFKACGRIEILKEPPGTYCTFWMSTARFIGTSREGTSRKLLRLLDRQGIQTRPLWQPMHQSPAQQDAYASDCSLADVLNAECLCLPSSVDLEDAEVYRVAKSAVRIFE
ncbi:MAG: LegC family aminotransferase [Thermoanaerobaculales bacterium]|nr:LegC family aminotransferase [Thermoanaerobaculales bacterium]